MDKQLVIHVGDNAVTIDEAAVAELQKILSGDEKSSPHWRVQKAGEEIVFCIAKG